MSAKGKKPPLCILTWLDAHSPAATQVINLSEIDSVHFPLKIETTGWVLRDDHNGITMASEFCGDNDYRGVTFVPRGMVLGLAPVKGQKTKKPPAGGSFDEGITANEKDPA